MPLGNMKSGYGLVAYALHWLVFLGVLGMFYFGLQADWAREAGDRARAGAMMGQHISLGVAMVALVAARVAWRLSQAGRPAPVQQARPLMILSAAVHGLMYVALIVLVISGPLAVWSGGRAINFYGLFSLPSPFAERNEGVHEFAELMHAAGRFTIFFLFPVHVLGALKHLFMDGGPQGQRMFVPASKDS